MPVIMCPSCLTEFEVKKRNYDGEVDCPTCGAVIHVKIEEGELKQAKLALRLEEDFSIEEGLEGEEESEEDWC